VPCRAALLDLAATGGPGGAAAAALLRAALALPPWRAVMAAAALRVEALREATGNTAAWLRLARRVCLGGQAPAHARPLPAAAGAAQP